MKSAFIFEPIAAPFISYCLKRTLRDWKEEKKLDGYQIKTTRVKTRARHYVVKIDIDLTPKQTQRVLHQTLLTLNKQIEEVKSWLKTKVRR